MNLNELVVTEILDVVTVYSPKERHDTMVNRKSYGLSFTTDGQITYTLNGETYVSDRNHAVILPKGQTYTIQGNKEGHFPVINFEAVNFSESKITVIPIDNVDLIYKDYERMKKHALFKEQRLAVLSSFYNILYTLSHYEASKFNPLIPAVKHLENHFSCDITNEQLARKCDMGQEYFRKLFKKTYGVSPKQYLTDIRINKAKQMLKEGALKISVIAEECGFSNQYHFCRFFNQKTGLSPSEYRKQNRISKI